MISFIVIQCVLRHADGLIEASMSEPHTSELNGRVYIYTYIYNQGNVEHCGASVSKQCTTALHDCYVAKALLVKYQITARPFMHGM